MHGARTFLFTDLEGSTRTWEREPDSMDRWLARHDGMLTETVTAHRGRVFKHTGDGMCAVFDDVGDAVLAAREAQRALTAAGHAEIGPLRVRMALHSGDARERAGDFFGPTLNRCARVLEVGHGGQILLSGAAAAVLAEAHGGDDLTVIDLGRHRLRDLQQPERLWQLVGEGLQRDFPPLSSLDAFVHNLPLQRSSFIGRENERQALDRLLDTHRLVTVTGVGGCGKTRLALEVAAGAVDRYPDGVFFVDLSVVTEAAMVASSMAAALHLPPELGALDDRLADFLADRRALIVCDNCEHVLDATADTIEPLLAHCPRLSILATSREPLALDDEHVWRVPSLDVPEGDDLEETARSESVRLFVDRAGAARSDFSIASDNSAAIAEICRRLDGIPLAIELAAARVVSMTPGEIAERLSDRFRLLSGGRRRVQRQQTLHAVLDWSHDLLTDSERCLLRRLAVFAGGWSLAAAEAVCGSGDLARESVVDLLGTLVARSLVERGDEGTSTRYRLLETVRLYAQERLLAAGEAPAMRDAHAQWYLTAAETVNGRTAPEARCWFGYPSPDLLPDLDNLRQAADWLNSEDRHVDLARLTAASASAFATCGRVEEASELLSMVEARDAELPRVLRVARHCASANVAEALGDFLVANERARTAIALAQHPREAGGAYSILVANLTWSDPAEAERLLDDASEWVTPLGPQADDYLRTARASLANARHDYDLAADLLSGVTDAFANPSLEEVVARLLRGDVAAATRILDKRAPTFATTWFQYFVPFLRALIAARTGNAAAARDELRHAVALVRRRKIPLGLADCVLACAALAFHGGDARRASELIATARAATQGGLRSPMSMTIYRYYVREVRRTLDADAVAEARRIGSAVTIQDAIRRELGEGPA